MLQHLTLTLRRAIARGVTSSLVACTVAIAASGCVSNANGRRQLLLISSAQEMKLGSQSFEDIRSKEKICQDAAAKAAIVGIGQRIAAVSPQPKWGWTFELFDAPTTLNAFALPGGKVGVYSGLIPAASNAAGLAAVMGHEVAHAILRHGAERVSQGLVVQAGVDAAGVAFENSAHRKTIMASLGVGAQLGVVLPYSRDMESEADEIGLLYMAKAGYDPAEAVAFWERFRKATGPNNSPEFLSTHPATDARIAALRKALPEAQKIYAASQRLGQGGALTMPQCGGGAAPAVPAATAPAPAPAAAPARSGPTSSATPAPTPAPAQGPAPAPAPARSRPGK